MWGIDDALSGPHDDFVAAREASAFVTAAVLIKGEWHKGEVSFVDTLPSDSVWIKEFHSILDQTPDETMITIIDCHT